MVSYLRKQVSRPRTANKRVFPFTSRSLLRRLIGVSIAADESPSNKGTAMSDTWETANEAGARLYQKGHYVEAEQQLRTALQEAEKFGPQDSRVAVVLNNLGSLSHNQGKRAEAAGYYERALSIREAHYGPHHPWVAQSLNNLASLYRELGRYAEAETFLQRALKNRRSPGGPDALSHHQLSQQSGRRLYGPGTLCGGGVVFSAVADNQTAGAWADSPRGLNQPQRAGRVGHCPGQVCRGRAALSAGA